MTAGAGIQVAYTLLYNVVLSSMIANDNVARWPHGKLRITSPSITLLRVAQKC